ncbi:hypothetical protein ACRRTK_012985 [Alexandromys fortis]
MERNHVHQFTQVLLCRWCHWEPRMLLPGRNCCLGCALSLAASTGGLSRSGMCDPLSFYYFGFMGIQGSVKY